MRTRFAAILLVVLLFGLPLPAMAQLEAPRPAPQAVPVPPSEAYPALLPAIQPHAGSLAIGADFGFYRPATDFLVSLTPEVLLEFYVTERVSIRLLGGWARTKFANGTGSMDHLRSTTNVAYNWEYDYWHPYVSAGIGLYSAQGYSAGRSRVGLRYNHVGLNVAAGVEYFWSPKVTVKFEFDYHRVNPVWEIGNGPGGFALTAGVKRYF